MPHNRFSRPLVLGLVRAPARCKASHRLTSRPILVKSYRGPARHWPTPNKLLTASSASVPKVPGNF
jgi:hypothetical protein